MKIISGEYEVYASGIIASPDLSDTKFTISENPLMEVVCRIKKDAPESSLTLKVIGDSTIALVFNRPSGLGYGPAKPIKVGTLNGRGFYVSFLVSLRGNEDSYGLEYTFYLKEFI